MAEHYSYLDRSSYLYPDPVLPWERRWYSYYGKLVYEKNIAQHGARPLVNALAFEEVYKPLSIGLSMLLLFIHQATARSTACCIDKLGFCSVTEKLFVSYLSPLSRCSRMATLCC